MASRIVRICSAVTGRNLRSARLNQVGSTPALFATSCRLRPRVSLSCRSPAGVLASILTRILLLILPFSVRHRAAPRRTTLHSMPRNQLSVNHFVAISDTIGRMRESERSFHPGFGQFVRLRRTALGMDKTEFALRVGVSPSYLREIEKGLAPGPSRIRAMAQGLGEESREWLAAAGISPDDSIPEQPSSVPESNYVTAIVGAARHPLGMILSDGRVEYHTEVRTQMRYHAVAVVSDGVKGVLSGNDLVIMDSQADICLESLVLIRRGERREIVRCVGVDGGDDGGLKVATLPEKTRATTSRITRADVIGVAVYAVRPLQ